jgi:hypothetical protein
MYPNWDFWFENKPSGNPAWKPFLKGAQARQGGVALVVIVSAFRTENLTSNPTGV